MVVFSYERSDIIFNFFRKKENRADSSGFIDTSDLTILSENSISRSQAMEIPTVSACINKISETIARLPVKLHQKNNGKITEILDDSRLVLLNGETGDTLNTVDMWKSLIEDYFLGGGGWIYINSDGLKIKSLHYVDCNNISIMTNNDPIFKAFNVFVNGKKYYDFQFLRVFRKTKNGYSNIPVQADNPKILSVAYNSLKLENKMNKTGGNKGGFLKAKTKLSSEALENIKTGCRALYDNDNDKIPVLNDGLDFQPVSSTAVELQINENKKINSVEICKLFGFPHTIIDGGASDDDNKKFVSAITALINQLETALDSFLLLETEKENGYYFTFDTKELTRGSLKERYEAYQIGIKNHILQVDEVRREEDFEPLGFNFVTMGLGDVLLNPKTMEVFTPNTGQTSKLNSEQRADIELRYNHNHDQKGRFSSGGGGGWMSNSSSKKLYSNGGTEPKKFSLTDFLNDDTIKDKETAFREHLSKGDINTTIEKSQQQKHQVTKAWKNQVKQAVESNYKQTPKSLLDKSIDPQKFVDKYAGTGKFDFPNSKTVVHEFITTSEPIGRTFDFKQQKYVSSNTMQIKYTQNGIHIFPTIKRSDK